MNHTTRTATALFLLLGLCYTGTRLAAAPPVDPAPMLAGLTGVIRVPTAEILPDGAIRLGYNQFNDEKSSGLAGTVVYHVGLGILPGVEGALGMGNAELNQDLTAHAKWQVHPATAHTPAVAIGIADVKRSGSDPSDDPTGFVVATQRYDRDRLALTLGAALGPAHTGLLAGATYQVLPNVELQTEYDTERVNTGVAVRAAKGLWLRAADTDIGSVISASYQFALPRRERPVSVVTQAIPAPTLSPTETVAATERALVDLGMENVRVSLARVDTGDQLRVRYENRRYTLDQADGIHAVLTALARVAPASVHSFALTLLQRDTPVVTLETSADAFRQYQVGSMDLNAFRAQLHAEVLPEKSTSGQTLAETAIANRYAGHTDLSIGPGVLNTLGTEVSSFEYGITVRPEVKMPLAKGLLADSRWVYPLTGELVEDDPRSLQQDRLLLGYLFRPSGHVIAQGIVGRFTQENDGAALEVAMPVGKKSLLHGVAASLSRENDTRQTYLQGEYWRVFPEVQAQARVFAGQFIDNDKGWGVDMLRFFGNLQIGVGYRDTNHADLLEARAIIPLSPIRQPQRPQSLRLRTPDYLNYRLRSALTSQNYQSNDLELATSSANELPMDIGLVDSILDFNRLLPDYLIRHLR